MRSGFWPFVSLGEERKFVSIGGKADISPTSRRPRTIVSVLPDFAAVAEINN
jgi:hypothetical protein